MYRNILVYIDSGLPSLAVGKIAIKISEHFRSKTYLFSVISKAERKENILKIEHSVKTLFEEALEKNIPVEEQIETGSLINELKKKIKNENIDLLCLPLSEKTISHEFKKLINDISIDVCLIKITNFGKVYPKNILFPVRSGIENLSRFSKFLITLTESFQCNLTLINLKKREGMLSEDISLLTDSLDKKGIHYNLKISSSDISKGIILEVSSRKTDIIIMGYSKRSFLKRLIFGNPLYEIIEKTPTNLIIFKPSETL